MPTSPLLAKVTQIFFGKIVTAVASFLMIIVLTKHYELKEFGMFVFITSACMIIAMVSNWGTNEYIFRKCSTDKSSATHLLRTSAIWKLLLAFVLGTCFIIYLLLTDWNIVSIYIAILLLLASIFDTQSMSYIMIWRAFGLNKPEAVFFPTRAITKLALVYIAVLNDAAFITIAIVIFLNNALGHALVLYFYSRWKQPEKSHQSNKISFRKLAVAATPYAIFGVIGAIYSQNGSILTGILDGQETVALYGVGLQFYQVAVFLPVAINIAIQPSLSRMFENDNIKWGKQIAKYYKYLTPVSILFGVILYYVLPFLLQEIFDQKYEPSKRVIEIFMLAFIFRFITSSLIGSAMISAGKISTYNYVLLTALAMNIIANVVLIPQYHEIGGALSFLASELVIAITGSILLTRITKNHIRSPEVNS